MISNRLIFSFKHLKLANRVQRNYLQYQPSLSRTKQSVKEPQVLDYYYKYRYVPNNIPETLGEAEYVETEPYYIATLYEWDNTLPSEYNDHFSYAPIWAYVLHGGIYIWMAILIIIGHIESDYYKKPTAQSGDYSCGLFCLSNNFSVLD